MAIIVYPHLSTVFSNQNPYIEHISEKHLIFSAILYFVSREKFCCPQLIKKWSHDCCGRNIEILGKHSLFWSWLWLSTTLVYDIIMFIIIWGKYTLIREAIERPGNNKLSMWNRIYFCYIKEEICFVYVGSLVKEYPITKEITVKANKFIIFDWSVCPWASLDRWWWLLGPGILVVLLFHDYCWQGGLSYFFFLGRWEMQCE